MRDLFRFPIYIYLQEHAGGVAARRRDDVDGGGGRRRGGGAGRAGADGDGREPIAGEGVAVRRAGKLRVVRHHGPRRRPVQLRELQRHRGPNLRGRRTQGFR